MKDIELPRDFKTVKYIIKLIHKEGSDIDFDNISEIRLLKERIRKKLFSKNVQLWKMFENYNDTVDDCNHIFSINQHQNKIISKQ